MTVKSILIVGAMSLATVGFALAKSYDIQLLGPAKAGNTELKAGEYKLKVEGSQVTFTDAQTRRSVTVPVKVKNSERKFSSTELETDNQNGVDIIQSIDLGDSHTQLALGQ